MGKPKQRKTPKKLTVLDIATIHEFGLGNSPSRSWLRAWVDESKSKLQKRIDNIADQVILKNGDPDKLIEQLGLLCVGDIQKRIASGINPELHPLTIKRKGSSVPLIDTGQFRSSITYKVSKNG